MEGGAEGVEVEVREVLGRTWDEGEEGKGGGGRGGRGRGWRGERSGWFVVQSTALYLLVATCLLGTAHFGRVYSTVMYGGSVDLVIYVHLCRCW